MPKLYRGLPKSRNRRHVITTLSRVQVVTIETAGKYLFRDSITVGRQL